MKWTEREFWAALVPAIVGVLYALGVVGPDDNELVSAVTAMVLIAGPAIAYIVMRVTQKKNEAMIAGDVQVAQIRADAVVEEARAATKTAAATPANPVAPVTVNVGTPEPVTIA